MAHEYPQVTFVGVDMSPMFPDAKNTPSNVFFLQLNLNDGLPFPDETFDFVNQRFLCNNVVFEQWKFYVKEMIRVTKSGK
jgi:ubiquinone/menaquinone biosynthesis C-methylase UbiE